MRCYFKGLFAVFLVLLAAGVAAENDSEDEPRLSTQLQKRYQLEHQVLPDWAHHTEGAFFSAALSGSDERLREVAAEIVSPDYARKIVVQPDPANQIVLLKLPAPENAPECYFVYITKTKGENVFRYFTYEKTIDVFGSGVRGVIGEWTKDHEHLNHGEKTYENLEDFVKDAKRLSAL